MPAPFSIWIVTPPGYLHSRCFEEVALGLREAFTALGFDAPIVTDPAQVQGTALVLGGNLLHGIGVPLPPQLIFYNLEQVQRDSHWLGDAYLDVLRRHPVWDYSARNIEKLRAFGIKAALCGIGYMPGLTRIPPSPAKDIDVLFIGSTNERRMQVLNAIAASGANVFAAYNTYGPERDALIARAKIVLNLHFYEAQVFEIVRVSYLLANRVCVLSETGHDMQLEAPLKEGIAFAGYDALADACQRLLKDDAERARLAQAGFDCFFNLSQIPMLKSALEATVPGVSA